MSRTRMFARASVASLVSAALAIALAAPAEAVENAQRAKELFQEGTTYFDLGQFDKAIEAWQEGYKQKPDPGFLYNIGQAYRLSGDAQKAIFFYRGYLRNNPHARNRAEVEQKIEALQKLVSDQDRSKQLPPPGVLRADGGGTAPAATAPPAVASATPPPGREGGTPGASVGVPVSAAPPGDAVSAPAAPPERPRPVDLGAALGADLWTAGIQGSSQPSFAARAAAGYTFGADERTVRFRLGGAVGYTFLSEPTSKETFLSLLVEPGVRVRLLPDRLFLWADLGVGLLMISGLKPASALLVHQTNLIVSGTQGLLELRPAVAVEVALTRALSAFLSPALVYDAKRAHFYGAIGRVELLAGMTFRL